MLERIDLVLDYMRESGGEGNGALFSNIPSGFIPGVNENLFPKFNPLTAKVVSFATSEWIDMGMPKKLRVVLTPVDAVKGGDGE